MVVLTDDIVESFGVAKVIGDHEGRVNSLDFSLDGSLLIAATDKDSIVIHNCDDGGRTKQTFSKKYGVDLIRLTRLPDSALHASTKVDHTIRFLNIKDNKYIRYFKGHDQKVTSLRVSPVDNTFLSLSMDGTLRLWDLRKDNCQGVMNLSSRPVAAFDPMGVIFAVGMDSCSIKLYDLRSFEKGPFSSFDVPTPSGCEWTDLTFSPDGKLILISTNSNWLPLINAFTGYVVAELQGYINDTGHGLEGAFSVDSNYVFAGASDGHMTCWNVATGKKLTMEHYIHPGPVQCCKFNPIYQQMATACSHTAIWCQGSS